MSSIALIILFIAANAFISRLKDARVKEITFFVINIFAFFYLQNLVADFSRYDEFPSLEDHPLHPYLKYAHSILLLLSVFILHLAMRTFNFGLRYYWLALTLPFAVYGLMIHHFFLIIGDMFILTRVAMVAIDVRKQKMSQMSFVSFCNYTLYAPLLISGPFVKPAYFVETHLKPFHFSGLRITRSFYKIIVGVIKTFFLSNCFLNIFHFYYFSHTRAPQLWPLFITSVGYYIFLFFSFSGMTDISSGISSLCGVSVPRNFKNPIFSRNLQDHWNRWHVTFMDVLRDAIFFPVSINAYRRGLSKWLAIPLGILLVFSFLAFWQGFKLRYFAFCMYHATGLIVVFYFSQWKNSSRFRSSVFWNNRYYIAATWLLTFVFISSSYLMYSLEDWMLRNIINDIWIGKDL